MALPPLGALGRLGQRAARQHRGHVAAVGGGRVDVGGRVDLAANLLGGRVGRVGREWLAPQRRLGLAGAHRTRAGPGHRQAHVADGAVRGQGGPGADPDQGQVAVAWTSGAGSTPRPTCSAAALAASVENGCPRSAAPAWRARTGPGPAPVTARRTSRTAPSAARASTAPTPTRAKSPWRRLTS